MNMQVRRRRRREKMFDPTQAYGQGEGSGRIADKNERYMSSESLSFKEDSDEIDALLSVEEEEYEEEDDVMSTGRTPSNNSYNSPDSACSEYGKQRCGGDEKGKAGTTNGDRKKARVKKMVKVLRGIVPGGRQMDTPAFLDEAVKYLKSLKMEAKKLGIQNSNNLN